MNDLVGNNVKRFRELKGLKQGELAQKSGWDRSNLSKLENGNYTWTRDNLKPLADTLEIDVARFFEHGYKVGEYYDEGDLSTEMIRVPIWELKASAGPGSKPNEYFEETKDSVIFRADWLRSKSLNAKNLRTIKVEGRSMAPRIEHGDQVVVDLSDRNITSGRVYVFDAAGEIRIKRLFIEADGTLRVVSDNPDKTEFKDEYVNRKDRDSVKIIGRVRHRMGSEGL